MIWDFETRVVARTFKPHSQVVTCLAWGRSGHHLHSGSAAGEVSVWDVLNNAQVRQAPFSSLQAGHVQLLRTCLAVQGMETLPNVCFLVSARMECLSQGCLSHTGG